MYRILFRTVYAARNSSITVYESCALPAKCYNAAAPIFRVSNIGGIKALSTSSVSLCEKKHEAAASNQDEKTYADKEADLTETPTLVTQKAEDDSRVVKRAEHSKPEPAVLKADDGSPSQQQQADVQTEKVTVMPAALKDGKGSLRDLLGTMKIEVRSKKKPRKSIMDSSYERAPKPRQEAMESTKSMFQKAIKEAPLSQSETLNPELVAAASAAASTRPDHRRAESELLRKLWQQKSIAEAQKKGDMRNLGVLIADMKVEKNPKRGKNMLMNQIKFDDDGQGFVNVKGVLPKKELHPKRRLFIFSTAADEDAVDAVAAPTLWDLDYANEVTQHFNQLPHSGFDEMIQWTKEGKMWQYPINNEAGLEEEASVPFHEHIFLEKHLEEGFPSGGPVRHFMELVLAGLSRNPYLTVQQKQEHISWFRDYFNQKEEVLIEGGVSLN